MSHSGRLSVERGDNGRLVLDFPGWSAESLKVTSSVTQMLGAEPEELHQANYYMAVFRSEQAVRALKPDMEQLAKLGEAGLIVTAPGEEFDFVSRYFAPGVGIQEDPVTGSAHCALAPFWAKRLGKPILHAHQASIRGGELWCEVVGTRVRIAGNVVEYLSGSIRVPC